MAVSPAFSTHVTDLLKGFGAFGLRRMFGGAGLFRDDLMFGLIADDTLYFKVDDGNRPDFEAQGMRPFTYQVKSRNSRSVMSYFQVPPDLLEEPGELVAWAEKAYAAARAGGQEKAVQEEARDRLSIVSREYMIDPCYRR